MISSELAGLISSKETQYGLPDGLLTGLVSAESSGNPNAYNSKTGASGLTQIIKKYHPNAPDNLFDPQGNLDYAAKTIRMYADNFGSYAAALAAWHAGPGRVQSSLDSGGDGIPGTKDSVTGISTRNYVNKILKFVTSDSENDAIGSAQQPTNDLQSRPFNRRSLGIIGLGLIFLGALVVASRAE